MSQLSSKRTYYQCRGPASEPRHHRVIQRAEGVWTKYHLGLWQEPMPPAPVLATEFERQVRTLRLTPETYVFSAELRQWCWQNRDRFYIPKWLLEEWRIAVDPYTCDAA